MNFELSLLLNAAKNGNEEKHFYQCGNRSIFKSPNFTCVTFVDDEADVFVELFLRSKAGSSSIITFFCDPITLLCDIGGVCSASRCPYAEYLSALLLTELYLLPSYTGDGDGFDETEWFVFNVDVGTAITLFE